MQIISVVNTTLLHGPMVESLQIRTTLDVEGPLLSYVQIFNCTAGLCSNPPILFKGLAVLLLYCIRIVSDSCCIFPVPAQQSGISLEAQFSLGENGFRNNSGLLEVCSLLVDVAVPRPYQ